MSLKWLHKIQFLASIYIFQMKNENSSLLFIDKNINNNVTIIKKTKENNINDCFN